MISRSAESGAKRELSLLRVRASEALGASFDAPGREDLRLAAERAVNEWLARGREIDGHFREEAESDG